MPSQIRSAPQLFSHRRRCLSLPYQRCRIFGDVRDVGRRSGDGVNQTAVGIGINMRFHTEVSLIALFSQMHVAIALAVGIVRRWPCIDDGRLPDRSRTHQQAYPGQGCIDRL